MDSTQLLAAVRAAQGLPSNYALARFLDVRENTLHRWHTGRNTPDDLTAAKLAALAGLDPDSVVAAMHAQRATEGEERALWERMAARLSKAASVAAAVMLSLCITGKPDAFSPMGSAQAAPVNSAVDPLYIVRYLRCALARFRGMVRRLALPMLPPCLH